jgi:hypothetical protein
MWQPPRQTGSELDLSRLKERGAAASQAVPKLLDFVVSSFLTDLAIALKTNDQTHTICELLEVLMKGNTLGGPVVTMVTTESFEGRMNALNIRQRLWRLSHRRNNP